MLVDTTVKLKRECLFRQISNNCQKRTNGYLTGKRNLFHMTAMSLNLSHKALPILFKDLSVLPAIAIIFLCVCLKAPILTEVKVNSI